jgi:toxin-antitoxin system PIN domain toxin
MPDVNVLVNAHREGADEHARYAEWLSGLVTGAAPFALSELVLHGFLRVITNPRIFPEPASIEAALQFVDEIVAQPGCRLVRPGPEHRSIFQRLCKQGRLKGDLVADAAHAAVAIENGCEWVSADTDFARLTPELRWRHL